MFFVHFFKNGSNWGGIENALLGAFSAVCKAMANAKWPILFFQPQLGSRIKSVTSAADLILIMGFAAAVLAGCGHPPPSTGEFIIKAGTVQVSSAQFTRELELKLSAYPYDIKMRPLAYNDMVLDLVSTLVDETVILASAWEKGITVSDDELEAAETNIIKDYPGDSFKHMLRDNAIEYTFWKNRLKRDLIVSKFLNTHLVAAQEINAEDMIAFYKGIENSDDKPHKDDDKPHNDMNVAALIKQLRIEKSQMAYEPWITALKRSIPPEINETALVDFMITQARDPEASLD